MTADHIPLSGQALTRLALLGLDVDQVLRHASISPTLRHQAKVSLTTRQYFALWTAVEVVSGDELIGLRLGGEVCPDQFDPASFAALHSNTFGEALDRLARYKRLSCPETIRVASDGDTTRISFHWLRAKDPVPSTLIDAAFANINVLLRYGTGKAIAPLRIERTQLLRGSIQRYTDHFGCEVCVGAELDALVYSRATLDERFVTRNLDLITALLPGLEMQLAAASPPSFDLQVKAVLTQMMRGERPSIEAVARKLCLSPRTMQRRLTEAQTSYQSILDAVRLDTACKLLEHTDMEPGEIAFYLGFEEVNSFQRAFHKWQGMTPTQWRTQTSIDSNSQSLAT